MSGNTHTHINVSHVLLTTVLLSCLLLIPGCTNEDEKLYLYTAASMSDVAAELTSKFEATNPQIDVLVNSAGSGTLTRQILNGAPWDVYISASLLQTEKLTKAENTSVKEFLPIICTNTLVLAVQDTWPRTGELTPDHELGQLLTGVHIDRIGMGNPGYVPAGHYARELLSEKQLFSMIQSKIVYASSVRQALGWLEAGEVDAAFLYTTDAESSENIKVLRSWDRPAGREIVYPVAFNANSTSESSSRLFARFLFSAYSKKVLRNHGFTPNPTVFKAEDS